MPNFIKKHSKNVFHDIVKAEAAVRQQTVDTTHLRGVGAIDSIVDIVGFFILWKQLGIEQVYSTPVTDGSSTITIAYGVIPIPVLAVVELRKEANLIIRQNLEIETKLVTPTGLAVSKELSPPSVTSEQRLIEKMGYGFGKWETSKFNTLRGLVFTETHSKKKRAEHHDQVLKTETNIDN